MTKRELLEVGKPILFNTEMVQAILNNRKTVTRRVCKEIGSYDFAWALDERPYFKNEEWSYELQTAVDDSRIYSLKAPYQTGDILYVRETWLKADDGIHYRADETTTSKELRESYGYKWKPSIHMPKDLARIFLKVKDVKIERLQDIKDSWRFGEEGINEVHGFRSEMVHDFIKLWNSTIKKIDLDQYGWKANPWVWVIEFERVGV